LIGKSIIFDEVHIPPWASLPTSLVHRFPLKDRIDEQRKFAILFAATILAARKLNDIGITPWANECAINDAIQKAAHILEKLDERWAGPKRCRDFLTLPRR
jgi:hypothetical protein